MKKLTSIFAIVMICLVCVLSLAGCGNSNLTADGRYKTVEAYLADPLVKSTLEDSMSTGTDELAIEILGDENNLIYQYTFEESYDAATIELMKETFESSTDSLESTMVGVANDLKESVAADDLGVVVRYLDANGTLIYEATFKADK